MKLSQAQKIVMAAIEHAMNNRNSRDSSRLVPCLMSAAGLGKTTMVKDICKDMDIECRIMSLGQYDAGEIAGWSVPNADNSGMNRVRPDWMPTDGRGVLFLDEVFQCPTANMNIAAQLCNEYRVGPHHLPEGWVVVCASNRLSDRAGTSSVPSHLKDRLLFLDVEADLNETVGYLVANGADERVCGFLRFRPEFLHRFDKDAMSCPTPRSWDRVSTILSWNLDPVDMLEAIAGQVGQAAAADFAGYMRLHEAIPDIDAVIAKPKDAPIPDDAGVLYAVCAALTSRVTTKNIDKIMEYLVRLPQQEMTAFVVADAVRKDAEIKRSKSIRAWAGSHSHLWL